MSDQPAHGLQSEERKILDTERQKNEPKNKTTKKRREYFVNT